ncbi:MAG: flavodoxin [Helicobacteraceae bacterium]|jgi:flavodoxin I|nr:flavodoxin [Helicobacteraceae bacterium]
MAKVGIFYGSTSGNTANIAEAIGTLLSAKHDVTLKNIASADLEEVMSFNNLLFGCSTWGEGGLQTAWREPYSEMQGADFTAKTVALFGAGDSQKHSESFAGALGILYALVSKNGAKVVGFTDSGDYNFTSSQAAKNGKFVGLALDETNEAHKTKARIEAWVKAIEGSFT